MSAMSRAMRQRLRHFAAILFSAVLVGYSALALVFFAGGGAADNPNAHAILIVDASVRTCIALGALVLSTSQWRGTQTARWAVLKGLWLLSLALMLIEWALAYASSA